MSEEFTASVTYVNGKVADFENREKAEHVFIDAGARMGEIFQKPKEIEGTFFKSANNLDVRKNLGEDKKYYMPESWDFIVPFSTMMDQEIHLFEPNNRFLKELNNLAREISHVAKSVTVHPHAIWIKDEYLNFYLDTNGGYGSTLIKDKKDPTVEFAQPMSVKTIDFCGFLLSLECEHVHIKMDIEGAELDVLEEMFKNSTVMEKIRFLAVEFHKDFLPIRTSDFLISYLPFINEKRMNGRCYINWWPGEW